VHLPRDDAPHNDFMEWWYYNGHLTTADGRLYSFHYVFFVLNSTVPYTVAHVALTDHQSRKRFNFQRKTSAGPSFASPDRFDFLLSDWVMSGGGGSDILKVTTREFGFDLKLEDTAPAVFHGGSGLLDFRRGGTSYYYSRPRMKVSGILSIRGKPITVRGESWFDHQWGDFHPPSLSWNWFALQLDNGADIMLNQISDGESRSPLFFGTYTHQGRNINLNEPDVTLSATESWKSPATGINYPVAWQVRIPKLRIDLKVVPVMTNSEVDSRESTDTIYWEGAVRVSGSHTGKGFLEINPANQKKAADK